jgi:hypothetical protein
MEFHYRGVDRDVLILRADAGIDAAYAHAFLSELSRPIEGIKLAPLTGPVFRLLELRKLAGVFAIYPSVDAAEDAFRDE